MSGNTEDKKDYIHPIDLTESQFIKKKPKYIRPIQYEDREKTVEEKVYIILYILNDEEDDVTSKTFSVCVGRTMAYMDIKNKLQSGLSIDVHRSCILTETKQTETSTGDLRYFIVPFDKAISVYAFCVSQSEYFNDEEFSIEDYADGEVPDNRMDFVNRVWSAEETQYRNMLNDMMRDRENNQRMFEPGNEGINV